MRKHRDSRSSEYWTKAWQAEAGAATDSKPPPNFLDAESSRKTFVKAESTRKSVKDEELIIKSALSGPTPDESKEKKHVQFSYVTIREYEIRPSDSPAVLSGVGIELGWKYKTLREALPVIDFETVRIRQRRKYYQYSPGLSPDQRKDRLLKFGFSEEELKKASKQSATLRKSNEKSVSRMKFDRISELREDMGRSWRRWRAKKKGVDLEEDELDLKLEKWMHRPPMLADERLESKNAITSGDLSDSCSV